MELLFKIKPRHTAKTPHLWYFYEHIGMKKLIMDGKIKHIAQVHASPGTVDFLRDMLLHSYAKYKMWQERGKWRFHRYTKKELKERYDWITTGYYAYQHNTPLLKTVTHREYMDTAWDWVNISPTTDNTVPDGYIKVQFD